MALLILAGLNCSTTDILGQMKPLRWGGCPVHCGMFSSVSGLCLLDISSTASCDNQKFLQTLPNVPGNETGPYWELQVFNFTEKEIMLLIRPELCYKYPPSRAWALTSCVSHPNSVEEEMPLLATIVSSQMKAAVPHNSLWDYRSGFSWIPSGDPLAVPFKANKEAVCFHPL